MTTGVSLEHDKTGAQHCHYAREDSNNTFSVMFRTTPMDSTGVPHILEHTTLCGSQKYPVRDPFFKMLNRTLATFMNAMTASDWTLYPFSTQNQKDYENLMSVYLDAVFFPQLRELDFSQEGWRLEHEDPNNSESPIIFKGVVYNEMKGVFSDSLNIFMQAVQNKLMPNHTYGVISGGDPPAITDLTWQQLKDFHHSHYHPTNSKFTTYGDLPLERHLELINGNYLEKFDRINIDTRVPLQQRWSEPRAARITCPHDPTASEKQTIVSASFLLSEISDVFESFTMNVISTLLTDGETSPFYQALLEANIGSDYAPLTGYQEQMKEAVFSVGLRGIHSDDVDKVKDIITATFDKVISEGFDQKNIDALLHRLELGLKHQARNFGLNMALNLASVWNHDGDPMLALQINNHITRFRQAMADNPNFLQDKVKEHFKDNQHCLVTTMEPDKDFEEGRTKEEAERLKRHVSQLTTSDCKNIFDTGKKLLEKQMSPEDLDCLPTIHLHEIERGIKPEPVETIELGGVPVQKCEAPTNGVSYLTMISNLASVSDDLKPYVPLFCNVITKMGAGDYDYKSLSQDIDLYTGGLSAGVHVKAHHTDDNTYEQGLMFSSYCLDRNLEKMLGLWTDVFTRPDLKDNERFLTLVNMTAAEMSSSIVNMGHSFAISHSRAGLTPTGFLQEQFGGMTQVELLNSIVGGEQESVFKVVDQMEKIGKCLLNKSNLRVAVNTTPESMGTTLRSVEGFLSSLPGDNSSSNFLTKDTEYKVTESQTQFERPFSVNYMGKSFLTVPYTHEDFPRLRVLAKLMWAKFLHREIREKGGAYGSGAVCSDGVFSLFSYRDPNSLKTLEVFDEAVKWLCRGDYTHGDVDEAKLSVFQETDTPVTPGKIGMTRFTGGVTDEMKQTMRDQLFQVSKNDVTTVALRYLKKGQRSNAVSFLGPANESVQEDKKWKIIKN
ncbi:presequence protease, mitochondrial-like isoform X2 [Mizuhopecten yessoensis]|nr:presequence protease, mitochondrial-like isoform X2 [Mizuhopecten yessoensis]